MFRQNFQIKRFFFKTALFIFGLSLSFGASVHAQSGGRLISREAAWRYGLERAWFAQVRLDSSRNHVVRSILSNDQLFVLTSAGVVHAFDAHTGRTVWVMPIGNPRYPSLGPAASDEYVALVNGSTLYVLDRSNGRAVLEQRLGGSPGAGPALGKKFVYVPLLTGRMEGYPLSKSHNGGRPWYYQAKGRAMVTPLVTPHSIVWSTDSRHLIIGLSENPSVQRRVVTSSELIAQPAYKAPYLYAISVVGDLYAIHEESGGIRWKYFAGFSANRAPAVVGERVYVTTEEPALHAIDASRGTMHWKTPGITQFAAASKDNVYGIDSMGALVIVDAETGTTLARIPGGESTTTLVNDQTDRLYLISSGGLVQCLHELNASQPLDHLLPPQDEADQDRAKEAEKDVEPDARVQPPSPEAEADPFGDDPSPEEPGPPEEPEEDPFGGAEEDDPFAF